MVVFVNRVILVTNRVGQVGSKAHSGVGLSEASATPHTDQGRNIIYFCLKC